MIEARLSAAQRSALENGAREYPYATFALVQILGTGVPDRDGEIYMVATPPELLTSLLRASRNMDDIYGLLAELQWTLYSPQKSFIEVTWQVAKNPAQATRQFCFQVRLLTDGSDATLPPGHPAVESPVLVLVTAGTVKFVSVGPFRQT